MRQANYDKKPATEISGNIFLGWDAIQEVVQSCLAQNKVLAIDCYPGVFEEDIVENICVQTATPLRVILTRDLFKDEEQIKSLTDRFMTDDVLFGYISNLTINDYFDPEKLHAAQQSIEHHKGETVIIGAGAAHVAKNATLIYADMARWEIQQRFRKHAVKALGIDNRSEAVSLQYKRGYFNDWKICDRHKRTLFHRIDYWLDTNTRYQPKMIDKETFFRGIDETIKKPFRVVPFFDPAPWGGQWMKEVCDLDKSQTNYGWCFDCVPEENSLYFKIDDTLFELPSIDLVYLKSTELLGEAVEGRFGAEFPIRFDFLDTIGGGNLSLQVHPTTQFIQEHFGMHYTQDESYYIVDAKANASVFLGLKNKCDKTKMFLELRKAQQKGGSFRPEKYVNKIPAKKHDHFLIPGGTIHCSGKDCMVLEISSTPNLFTFKLWDWNRLGLDGKPRPINIERGEQVINWNRNTEYVFNQLVNQCTIVDKGPGWQEERTGLHKNEFIETRRHRFTSAVLHKTNNSVNVLNLVEGDEILVESPTDAFKPFVVHYAETFIVPESVKEYRIRPYGKSENKECVTIKAFVRI